MINQHVDYLRSKQRYQEQLSLGAEMGHVILNLVISEVNIAESYTRTNDHQKVSHDAQEGGVLLVSDIGSYSIFIGLQ